MKWIYKEIPKEIVKYISAEYELDETFVQVLLNRGLDEISISKLVNNIDEVIEAPEDLINAPLASDRIISYLNDDNAVIYIRADYDVDGLTSGYVMGDTLDKCGTCKVIVSYPERSEGYGLQKDFCDTVIKYKNDNDVNRLLVLTVDNGITAVEEVQYLQDNDIEVIVTDHHTPKEKLPDCIIVDAFIEEESKFTHLCGCGVAFKICQLITAKLDREELLTRYLPALATGTICDMMPMTLENIAFCVYGLSVINSDECPIGYEAFKKLLGKDALTFTDLGWEIGPRLNACGRMGDVALGSKVFFADESLDVITALEDLIMPIDTLNGKRKELTKEKSTEAFSHVSEDDHIQLSVLNDCPEGLAGVIANKIIEEYQRPIIVLAKTNKGYVGSARSCDGISILDILQAEYDKGNLISFGGHENAGGLAVADNKINELRESLASYHFDNIELSSHDGQELYIDGTLQIKDLNADLLNALDSIPYDKDNFTTPIFQFIVDIDTKLTGPTKKNPDNLWLYIKDKTGRRKIWCKGLTATYNTLVNKSQIKIAAKVKVNFMNKSEVSIEIVDIQEGE